MALRSDSLRGAHFLSWEKGANKICGYRLGNFTPTGRNGSPRTLLPTHSLSGRVVFLLYFLLPRASLSLHTQGNTPSQTASTVANSCVARTKSCDKLCYAPLLLSLSSLFLLSYSFSSFSSPRKSPSLASSTLALAVGKAPLSNASQLLLLALNKATGIGKTGFCPFSSFKHLFLSFLNISIYSNI